MPHKQSLAAAIFLTLTFISTHGQTKSEVEAKYGAPVAAAYSVSELIWMTPEYGVDGQVCRMRLYPKRMSSDTIYVVKELPLDDFKNAVDELVPVNTRGAKKQSFGGWATGGGAMWAIFTFENVRIVYSDSFVLMYDSQVLKRDEFVFSI